MNRKEFLGALAGAAAVAGCRSAGVAVRRPEPDFYWSYLAHFGTNSWKDRPLEKEDPSKPEKWLTRCQADHVRFDEASWRRLSDALAKAGCNQIIIDLAEFVEYPSHPELAVKGSWSPDRLRDELDRLRGMGFEVVPKLNFSAGHDSWLKEYHRMVSTSKYYEVCGDVIRDVVEIFDNPRLFHLGYDEETYRNQVSNLMAVVRNGELWWHDLLWFVDKVEKLGVRPWIWADAMWSNRDEYLRRMPRSVLQSNWYYHDEFDPAKIKEDYRKSGVESYEVLDKAGFDQVPTGSNFCTDNNFGLTVRHCDRVCDKRRLKGYMMAPWTRTFAIHEQKSMEAIEQLAAARRNR